MSEAWTICESPIGPLTLRRGPFGITALHFPGRAGGLRADDRRPAVFAGDVLQLEQYFAGERRRFELALDLAGTPFQRRVWQALLRIPYGATVSYTRMAERAGHADRVREVAAAIARTPVPIVIPCHRVVASDGRLLGDLGGLERKRALLDLERRVAAGRRSERWWHGGDVVHRLLACGGRPR